MLKAERLPTYSFIKVCKFANLLLGRKRKKGDRVAIYIPMIVESLVAMLACARIRAIHFVVFAGFSAAALRSRIDDCEAKVLITSVCYFVEIRKLTICTIANEAVANNSIQSYFYLSEVQQDNLIASKTVNLAR